MSRSKVNTVIDMPTANDETDVLNQQSAQAGSSELEIIVRDFGDSIPFSEVVYKDKIRTHLNRSAEELLMAGKALYVSYEHIVKTSTTNYRKWGNFLADVGLEDRLARRMIQAAKKFYKPEARPLLQAAGNKTKLFELLVLDDDEITKVVEGVEDAPVTLDEVDRMSASELRKALREARADGEANKKVLEDKNHKLDKLQAELEKAKTPAKPARPQANYDVMALRTELTEEQYNLNIAAKKIGSILENLRESDDDYLTIAQETVHAMYRLCDNIAAQSGAILANDADLDTSWAEADDGDVIEA